MANIIDRIVGFVSPAAGLRRHSARQLLQRAYEGANQSDGWRPRRPGASANTDHAGDARTLRTRARALSQNVPYIARGLASHTANIIGTGIIPKWLGPEAKVYAELWKVWGAQADADGVLDIYGLEDLAHLTAQRDGEALVRIRQRRKEDGLAVPVQFQVLEIDWLDDSRNGRIDGFDVIQGKAYDALGRVVGYYLFDQHPGDMVLPRSRSGGSHFVPASSIIHYFAKERPGQGRGFPRIAPAIPRVRDLSLYEDAEINRKNLESRLGVLASGDVNALADGEGTKVQEGGRMLGDLPSGGLMQVPTGSNLTVVEPKAVPGYVDYVRQALHLIAAGCGWTYEMMTGDVSQVNFSSARIRRLDYKREAEREQWLHVIPCLITPMVRAFVDAAELAGLVDKADYNVRYATPKWEYTNPRDDVKSDLEEIAGGLSTFSEKLRQRGYDPEEVVQEMKEDVDRLRKAGLLDILFMMMKVKGATDSSPQQP
ncbi:phage portal protein [Comamonas aquatica]|uniref:Phage portal protein n=1 Tax=Comamonas aquatica TaxID=225991 RepID=A0AA43AVY7_9BURK|nr:phage portal protein [Comamonas aquatica]MDH1429104.1 phage portal protein [Comamonas aquatica]MDH1604981.1 phage portal protein [Comamonas aquatica]MDH1616005.1 phage portal protein [Comamonas aquatica]MDH2004870.1 phage portal protein [Comamonas aquatica]